MKFWPRRAFVVGLLASLLLHLCVVAGPGWMLGGLPEAEKPDVMEATLIAPPLPKPAPRPAVSRPRPRPVPPPTATTSAAKAEAEPDARPAPEPAPEPVAETPAEMPAEKVSEAADAGKGGADNGTAPADAAPEVAPPLPRQGRIRFSLHKGIDGFVVGESIHAWQHDGKRYTLSATSRTTGLAALFKSATVVQSSEGGFERGELRPSRFSNDRGEGDVVTAAFDWEAKTVLQSDGKQISIAEGAEDALAMFYQLMQAAQRGEEFVMAVATGRKVERYRFEWLPEETLRLKAGPMAAWRVRVGSAGGGRDTTEVWLGKDVLGLPVKIRQTDRKGDVFELVAEEIDYEGK